MSAYNQETCFIVISCYLPFSLSSERKPPGPPKTSSTIPSAALGATHSVKEQFGDGIPSRSRPKPRRPDFLMESLQKEGLWKSASLHVQRYGIYIFCYSLSQLVSFSVQLKVYNWIYLQKILLCLSACFIQTWRFSVSSLIWVVSVTLHRGYPPPGLHNIMVCYSYQCLINLLNPVRPDLYTPDPSLPTGYHDKHCLCNDCKM